MSQAKALQGEFFMNGDAACAEGALAAGCRFFAAYPITPATEIGERMAERLEGLGGMFIQMEDEMAAMAAVIGAAWGGAMAMTATSGPGFSLMMENLGLALMTETPCVVVDVQRGGPSTGLPTMVGQGDMMQARWGSHGDYEIVALSPESPQEMFDLTVRAFDVSERLRVPVLVMADEMVAHMTEKVVIPPPENVQTSRRRRPEAGEGALPFQPGPDLVPPMVSMGDGFAQHVTGLTHDERGYPAMNEQAQAILVGRLVEKIRSRRRELTDVERVELADADVVVAAYGITARSARAAVQRARARGLRVGLLRLRAVWPFPSHVIRELAARSELIVMPEINMGQIVREVERAAAGQCRVVSLPHAGGGLHDPDDIVETIVATLREARSVASTATTA